MDRIRLIASDMDETLLDENSLLPPGFEETVLALEQMGILFVAASGRSLHTLMDMFPTLQDHMAFIADNGGVVYWQGQILDQSLMPPRDYQELARFAHAAGDMGILCGLDCAYIERQFISFASTMERYYTKITYVDDLEQLDVEADKYTVYLPRGDAQRAYDTRYGPAFATRYAVAVSGSTWVDMMNRGVNKGTALRTLGRLRGLNATNMMAFGDTYNDLEMLQTARYGFIMTNGSVDMRKKVPFLAPSHWDQGVMRILRQVLQQGGMVSPEDFMAAH